MFKTKLLIILFFTTNLIFMQSCQNSPNTNEKQQEEYHLVVLNPAHFHAALLQKSMYDAIDSTVKVFAPKGIGLDSYLQLIKEYNSRQDNPTHWNEEVYEGKDYLQKMLEDSHEENTIVVLAGNNKKKTDYIKKSVEAGLNVLADKPMAITSQGFNILEKSFN